MSVSLSLERKSAPKSLGSSRNELRMQLHWALARRRRRGRLDQGPIFFRDEGTRVAEIILEEQQPALIDIPSVEMKISPD